MTGWEWYQKRIAEFFRRLPGAEVREDIQLTGNSKVSRQIDVWVDLPVKVKLGRYLEVPVQIKILVDAKKHERPVDIGLIEQIDGARNDVNAHVAIVASPVGFTSGARERARTCNVIPLTATSDLLAELEAVEIPWGHKCLTDCHAGGVIAWGSVARDGEARVGSCERCGTMHILCPDCGMVFGVADFEYGDPLKCPGQCGRIYLANASDAGPGPLEVHDELDVMLMSAAYANQSKQITKARADKLIAKTKWQYFTEESPTICLTEGELMEWTEDDHLRLTEKGEERMRNYILAAKDPTLF